MSARGYNPVMETQEPRLQQRWSESNRDLVEIIRGTIEREGRITFARFMELALYHPEHGYYQSASAQAGRAGDFITAPEAHPIFGHVLARQIDEMWRILARPDPFTLREFGAGAGTLALDIMTGLRTDRSELLSSIHYEPVETSRARRAELVRRLEAAGFSDRLVDPLPDEQIVGCVLANEFIDAFPVHRVVFRDGRLWEVYTVWRDGWFADELGPPSTPDLAAYFDGEGIALAEGQRAEVNLGIAGWMSEVAASLVRGYVLIIDYGYPAQQLFSSEQSEGTLKAYYHHGVHLDPYRAVGEQDLTAHVDFTALQRSAEQYGLVTVGLTTQAEFLIGTGIGDLLMEMQRQQGMTADEYLGARAVVMRLIDPGGMGRFRVLILARGVSSERRLRGLSPLV
jgi:SAM-dependent MidA family methyltransferase